MSNSKRRRIHPFNFAATFLPVALLTLLAGCTDSGEPTNPTENGSGGSGSANREPVEPVTEGPIFDEAQAYYDAHPDFFKFKTIADLPADLKWEDGTDQPELGSPEAKEGGTLRYYINDYPPTLRTIGPDSNSSFRHVHGEDNRIGIVTQHPNTLEWIPGVAREWAVGEDGRTTYYRIDPDARFSDGEAVTADDYLFTFFFMRSPNIRAPWYNNWYSTEYESVTKYDDLTFAITLPNPKPDPIFYTYSLPAIPQHFYMDFGDDYPEVYNWKFEPTTGPYEILPENVEKQQSITLSKVPNWWAADKKFYQYRFNVEKIRYRMIRDFNKAFETFKEGELDIFVANLPEYFYDKMEVPEYYSGYIHKATFYNRVPRPTAGLYLNQSHPLLSDINIRLGLQHATNWQKVIDQYFRGDYERLATTSDGFGRFTHPTLEPREFNVNKALEYFAMAGFDARNAQGVLVNDAGETLSFTLTVRSGPEADIVPILKEEAKKAGVDFQVEVLDPTAQYRKVMEKNHEVVYAGWVPSPPYPRFWEGYHGVNAYKTDEEGNFLRDSQGNLSPKPQTNNITLTNIPEMNALIEEYRTLTSEDEIASTAHRLQEMVHEDAAFIPGYKRPWWRVLYWRWVQWPEDFNAMQSEDAFQHGLFWIDQEMKTETLRAIPRGQTFEETNLTFDQFRE